MGKIRKFSACLLALCLLLACLASGTAFAAEEQTQGVLDLRLTASVEGEDAQEINSVLDSSAIDIAIGADMAGDPVVNVKADGMGMMLFRLLLKIGMKDGTIAFALPDVDGNLYSANLPQMVQNLNVEEQLNSIFGDAADQLTAVSEYPQISAEEYQAAFAPYLQIIGDTASANMTMEENQEIAFKSLSGTAVCDVTVIEPTEEDLINMLEAMADQAEGDAALKNVVVQWADYIRKLEPVLEMTGSSGEEVSADEAADALVQGVDQLPALLRQGAEYIRTEGLNGVQFRFKAAVSPEGVPKQLTAYAGNEEEAYEIGFEYLPEIGNTSWAVYMEQSEYGETTMYDLKFSGNSGNDSGLLSGTLSANVTMGDQKMTVADLTYNWNLNNLSVIMVPYGTAILSVSDGYQMARVILTVGQGAEEGDDHTLYVTGLDTFTGDSSLTGMKINLHASRQAEVEAPSGTFTDISGYTVEQLGELFTELGNKIVSSLQG